VSILKDLKTPVFNAERLVKLPAFDQYSIIVKENSYKEINLTISEFLSNFKMETVNCRLTSVSKWSVRANWQGILWTEFVKWMCPCSFTYTVFESYGGYVTAVYNEDLLNPRVLIAFKVNDEDIEKEYGGPIRMIIPNLWGYKSCKWLHKITFTDEYTKGYWESYGYDDRGFIEPSIIYDVNSKTNKEINGGEVVDF
jgi:DMSO/TMAO reductase YedYZ molybdopterin-dependent catalytic subunit